MPKIKGPAIFLAQFMRDEAPYDTMENIGKWVADLGYKGVQIPNWDDRVIDIGKAAESKAYCDEFKGTLNEIGLEATEVAGYLAGQVLAVHPAYEVMFEAFHPPGLRVNEMHPRLCEYGAGCYPCALRWFRVAHRLPMAPTSRRNY